MAAKEVWNHLETEQKSVASKERSEHVPEGSIGAGGKLEAEGVEV